MNKILKRSDKLAFFGVTTAEGTVSFCRMKGFSEISKKMNAKEYSRQYVDEAFEQSDVVGYSPSLSYSFDQFMDDPVHKELVAIAERELVGDEAVRAIVMVDLSQMDDSGSCPAVQREFTIISDAEGNSMEAYTYSGMMKVKGDKIFGTAVSTDAWETCSFTAE